MPPSPLHDLARSSIVLDCASADACLRSVSHWMQDALPRFLPAENQGKFLYPLVREYPLRKSKHSRTALMLLAAQAVGGNPNDALPTAMALELFQNFALVHDDIEDYSLLRRGQATLHRKHGMPLALNAGDCLLVLCYEALEQNAQMGLEKARAVRQIFSHMALRTLEGQAMDIGWREHDASPSAEEYFRMAALKTGWYSGRAPCLLGALIGGADAALQEALGNFGEALGIGFQLRDDVLNLRTRGQAYGKERGGDFAESKRTLIVIEMLRRLPPQQCLRLRTLLRKTPSESAAEEIRWAIQAAEDCGAITEVEARSQVLARQSEAALAMLPETPAQRVLKEFCSWLITHRER